MASLEQYCEGTHPNTIPPGARLMLFPGLGADERLFHEQARVFPFLESPRLIDPIPGETLPAYAARFAKTLDLTGPIVLGGFSFGGMLAMEIVKGVRMQDNIRAVVLISGCRSKRAITPEFQRRARLVQNLPPVLVSLGLRLLSYQFGANEPLTTTQRNILKAMAREGRPKLFQWAAKACAEWTFEGPHKEIPGVPIHQIHGERDRTIPMVAGDPETEILGAGHLLQFTHATQVNSILEQILLAHTAN